MRVRPLTVVLALLAAAACSDDMDPTAPQAGASTDFASANAPANAADARTYEVTVYNLTGGQPFTPPLATTHRRAADVFEVGDAAQPSDPALRAGRRRFPKRRGM